MAKRIPQEQGEAILKQLRGAMTIESAAAATDSNSLLSLVAERLGAQPSEAQATAVRYLLQLLAEIAPGRSVEVRVPPWGAVQMLEGVNHGRGTPPNVVEFVPAVFLMLSFGWLDWRQAQATGGLLASGNLSDISEYFPLREG